MEIKYEAVFGDQSLFDDAEPDVVLAETNGVYRTFHKESDKPYDVASVSRSDLAMRRIIRTPIWTKEDWKAGKLPPVGCRVLYARNGLNGEIVSIDDSDVDDVELCLRFKDKSLLVCKMNLVKPIESPEEKAARLEDEFSADIGLPKDLERIEERAAYKRGLRDAYRKLSGDLPVPAKEK